MQLFFCSVFEPYFLGYVYLSEDIKYKVFIDKVIRVFSPLYKLLLSFSTLKIFILKKNIAFIQQKDLSSNHYCMLLLYELFYIFILPYYCISF